MTPLTPRDFALLAQEAYTAVPDIGQIDSASRAIVRQTAAGLAVAFRGSDNKACWEADFDAFPMDVDGIGKLHRGIWRAWGGMSDAVLTAIDGKPVTLVGHSLGGALALMCAIQMTVSGNPPAAVWGFEPPRISPGPEFGPLLARVPITLYRNGNDIVPMLPEDWYLPVPLTPIGTPEVPFDNPFDHKMEHVIDALGTVGATPKDA
jgi:hypothetical protein